MVRTRVMVGVSLGAVFVGLVFVDSRFLTGGPLVYALVALLAVAGLVEFYALAEQGGDRPRKGIAIALGVAFMAAQQLVVTGRWPAMPVGGSGGMLVVFYSFVGLAAAVGFLLLAVDQLVWCRPERYLHDLSATFVGFFYVWFLSAHVLEIRSSWGAGCLMVFVVVAKLSDVGAYFTGTFLGRHHFAPRLSPKKTVEGAVGALVGGAAAAVLAAALLVPSPLAVGFWIVFGLVVALAAQVGDLVESGIKRSVGAKDSGHLLPTFGGVLDLIDSILFSAPVALWLLELWGRGVLAQ
jgi:phosphatidate cytidylyltransferase